MEAGLFKKFLIFIIKSLVSIYLLLTDFDIVFNLTSIFFVVLALTIHPFFFVFSLSDILRIEELKNVVKAIYYPRIEIILSLILFSITEYYFSLVGFILFHDHY